MNNEQIQNESYMQQYSELDFIEKIKIPPSDRQNWELTIIDQFLKNIPYIADYVNRDWAQHDNIIRKFSKVIQYKEYKKDEILFKIFLIYFIDYSTQIQEQTNSQVFIIYSGTVKLLMPKHQIYQSEINLGRNEEEQILEQHQQSSNSLTFEAQNLLQQKQQQKVENFFKYLKQKQTSKNQEIHQIKQQKLLKQNSKDENILKQKESSSITNYNQDHRLQRMSCNLSYFNNYQNQNDLEEISQQNQEIINLNDYILVHIYKENEIVNDCIEKFKFDSIKRGTAVVAENSQILYFDFNDFAKLQQGLNQIKQFYESKLFQESLQLQMSMYDSLLLLKQSERKKFTKNQIILKEGESSGKILFVVKGELLLTKKIDNDNQKDIDISFPEKIPNLSNSIIQKLQNNLAQSFSSQIIKLQKGQFYGIAEYFKVTTIKYTINTVSKKAVIYVIDGEKFHKILIEQNLYKQLEQRVLQEEQTFSQVFDKVAKRRKEGQKTYIKIGENQIRYHKEPVKSPKRLKARLSKLELSERIVNQNSEDSRSIDQQTNSQRDSSSPMKFDIIGQNIHRKGNIIGKNSNSNGIFTNKLPILKNEKPNINRIYLKRLSQDELLSKLLKSKQQKFNQLNPLSKRYSQEQILTFIKPIKLSKLNTDRSQNSLHDISDQYTRKNTNYKTNKNFYKSQLSVLSSQKPEDQVLLKTTSTTSSKSIKLKFKNQQNLELGQTSENITLQKKVKMLISNIQTHPILDRDPNLQPDEYLMQQRQIKNHYSDMCRQLNIQQMNNSQNNNNTINMLSDTVNDSNVNNEVNKKIIDPINILALVANKKQTKQNNQFNIQKKESLSFRSFLDSLKKFQDQSTDTNQLGIDDNVIIIKSQDASLTNKSNQQLPFNQKVNGGLMSEKLNVCKGGGYKQSDTASQLSNNAYNKLKNVIQKQFNKISPKKYEQTLNQLKNPESLQEYINICPYFKKD